MGFGFEFSRIVDVDFVRLFAIVWQKKWQVLTAGLIAGLFAVCLGLLVSQKYQGTTNILIENRDFSFNGHNLMVAQAKIIRSDIIVLKALKEFGLPGRVTANFNENLKVTTDKNSRILQLRFSSNDRLLASAVPNAIADQYIVSQHQSKPAVSRTEPIKAHIISHATSIAGSGMFENILFAAIGAFLAMGLCVTAISISALISGAGLKPSGMIPRELVPDAVQKMPEFAV